MARRRWVLGAVIIAAIAGCTSGDDDGGVATDAGDPVATTAAADSGDDAAAATTVPATPPAVDILTDFADACRGVAIPGATAYDPAVSGVHPIMVTAGEDPIYGESAGANLPDTWDPVVGQEQTVELVVCMARTSTTSAQICDGYQNDDGTDSGNQVEVFDVVYAVRLVAATTAEEIASTQLEATDEPCPMLVFFEEGETLKPWYAEPTEALTAWLADYVET